jgi:hypothetical protein
MSYGVLLAMASTAAIAAWKLRRNATVRDVIPWMLAISVPFSIREMVKGLKPVDRFCFKGRKGEIIFRAETVLIERSAEA